MARKPTVKTIADEIQAPDENVQATATVQEAPLTISIPTAQANRLLELYKSIEAADATYKNCQAPQFREFLQGVYKAPLISKAFNDLKTALETT